MFNSLGWPELLLIAAVALLIFGPKQLPKLGKMFGKTVKEVRSGIDEATQEAGTANASDSAAAAPTPAPQSPAAAASAPAPAADTETKPAPADTSPASDGPVTRH
jgi:sec-independent protein translocase protein TatA